MTTDNKLPTAAESVRMIAIRELKLDGDVDEGADDSAVLAMLAKIMRDRVQVRIAVDRAAGMVATATQAEIEVGTNDWREATIRLVEAKRVRGLMVATYERDWT